MKRYGIKIRNNETKEEIFSKQETEWHEYSLYYWTDGNGGCDCNRFLEFERAKNNNPNLEDAICGHGKYTILYAEFRNGKRILIDD